MDSRVQAVFDTGAVTNYVLELGERDKKPITPMKLLKLLYFAHGWHLAITDRPLIDDQVEAWPWGPVIPSVYHEFKRFGHTPIKDVRFQVVERQSDQPDDYRLATPTFADVEADADLDTAKAVLDRVWKIYGNLSARQLSDMTHQPGTPWRTIWDDMGPVKRRSKDIPDDLIRDYFKAQLKANRGDR
jgi:uncharacterized phage-associated protein